VLERTEKAEEPPMHATMKVAKMKPKGGDLAAAGGELRDLGAA